MNTQPAWLNAAVDAATTDALAKMRTDPSLTGKTDSIHLAAANLAQQLIDLGEALRIRCQSHDVESQRLIRAALVPLNALPRRLGSFRPSWEGRQQS